MIVDRKKMEESVATYWIRLCKRWEEQQARTRGEVHRDELTRRKQNQYRRQQSHLARRQAAFDQSPLNLCKLRALYRSLLTIDFVPATQERPDPKREYTENEWLAYQKLANNGRAPQAHEVVDIWWLSTNVRYLDRFELTISGPHTPPRPRHIRSGPSDSHQAQGQTETTRSHFPPPPRTLGPPKPPYPPTER